MGLGCESKGNPPTMRAEAAVVIGLSDQVYGIAGSAQTASAANLGDPAAGAAWKSMLSGWNSSLAFLGG